MITGQRIGTGERHRLYASTTHTYENGLDLIAIEQAMNGEPVTLTKAEQVEAARRLFSLDLSLEDIGARVGVTRHTVRAWADAGWPRPASDEREPTDIGAANHGRSGYSKGCRCRTCRDGAAEAARQYRQNRTRSATEKEAA